MIELEIKNGVRIYAPVSRPKSSRVESSHQIDIIALIRHHFPLEALLLFHPVNEGKHTAHHRRQQEKQGMLSGVSDIICLSSGASAPVFVCELKRPSATKSSVKKSQWQFLEAASSDKFACVAFGACAAWTAWCDYLGVTDEVVRAIANHIVK